MSPASPALNTYVHLRQLLAHRPGTVQPTAVQRLADPQRCGHLRARVLLGVGAHPSLFEQRDSREPSNSPIATNWAAAARFSARHDPLIRSTSAADSGVVEGWWRSQYCARRAITASRDPGPLHRTCVRI